MNYTGLLRTRKKYYDQRDTIKNIKVDESQYDQHQDLMTLKKYMNELERVCKELTYENLELIYNLNEPKSENNEANLFRSLMQRNDSGTLVILIHNF